MDYVIDIQGFYDKDDCFIAKEVAVIALDKAYIAHWITAPSHIFTDLPKSVRAKNNWATRHHHGLEWFEGDVPLRTLHANLRQITRTAGIIYTRGREKAKYLQSVTARQINNLEETNSPSFNDLSSSAEVCLHHGLLRRPELSCALNNAAKLKQWILRDAAPPIHFSPEQEPPVLQNPRTCYSPVVSSDEYDPDWPGIAGFTLDGVKKCTRSRPNPHAVDETNGSDC